MKVAVFNTKSYDKEFLSRANADVGHDLHFFEVHLNEKTCKLAFGYECVCAFVNDDLSAPVLRLLAEHGTKMIALRCAGFNNVDLDVAHELGLIVARVPAYSPHGVAEHTVSLMLALNRKIYRAQNRVREGNFSLDGLLGFELHGRTVGIIGTGKIGYLVARIMKGFGCHILGYDPFPNKECQDLGVTYVGLDELFRQSDVISLHVPLMPETHHIINAESIAKMKPGVMLINTSRGGLINTQAVIDGLKSGAIGYLGLDVYEEEGDLVFEDLSGTVIQDDVFARLLTFSNVIFTGHQAFFTDTAMTNISQTTLENISRFEKGVVADANLVSVQKKKS